MLTEDQHTFFETFGYLVLRQAFSAAEMAQMTRAADEAIEQRRLDAAGQSAAMRYGGFVDGCPQLAPLIEDDRVYGVAGDLLGDGFVWGGSEGNWVEPNEPQIHCWHSDRIDEFALGYRRIKTMIYLTPTTRDTGAFRVIPGSHDSPFFDQLSRHVYHRGERDERVLGLAVQDVPHVAIESTPGDVVFFDQYLFHSVYGKQPDRRYLAIKFAARPTCAEHLAALRKHGQGPEQLTDALRHSTNPLVAAMVAPLLEAEAAYTT